MLNTLNEKQIEEAVEIKASPTEIRRMREWLDGRVKRAKKEPSSEVVTLTPALASLLMERNTNNRNMRRMNSEFIRADIESGRFLFNGESISVSRSGELVNGQHRCDGVIKTGKSIQVVVVFGVPDAAKYTIDTGAPKSASNFLHMKGFTDTNNMAAAVGMIIQYQKTRDLPSGYVRATKSEIVNAASEMPGLQASIDIVQGAKTVGSRSVLAFCHYIFKKKSGAALADEFITKLVSGDDLRKGDPIFHCRERLIAMRGNTRAEARAAIVFRAWNHWRLGGRVYKIVIPNKLPKLEG